MEETTKVRHWATSKIIVGQVVQTKSGWSGVVKKYIAHDNVVVEWEDGSTQRIRSKETVTGAIKPLNQPFVEGIGYFGVGRFVPESYKHGEKPPKGLYGYWVRMFSRCYNPTELNKERNANYRKVFVSEEFHCFQRFAQWALSQSNFRDGLTLDKDLLGNGLLYSPECCSFLPAEINIFLSDKAGGKHGKGVNEITPKPNTNDTVGYIARVHYKGVREYLGFFRTPSEAFAAYKTRKEEVARLLANEYRKDLTEDAYNALMNYVVENT